MIAVSSYALPRVIDDVQDLSKIDAGQLSIHPQPSDQESLVCLVVAPGHQPYIVALTAHVPQEHRDACLNS